MSIEHQIDIYTATLDEQESVNEQIDLLLELYPDDYGHLDHDTLYDEARAYMRERAEDAAIAAVEFDDPEAYGE